MASRERGGRHVDARSAGRRHAGGFGREALKCTAKLAREEISALLRELSDGERRKLLGRNAATFIAAERSLEAAADRLKSLLAAL